LIVINDLLLAVTSSIDRAPWLLPPQHINRDVDRRRRCLSVNTNECRRRW